MGDIVFFFSPDTDGIKQEEPEAEKRLAVKDRRRGRKERRPTGLVQPDAEVAHSSRVFGFRSVHKQRFDGVSALQSRNNRFRCHRFLFVEVAPEPLKFTELHLDSNQAACPPVQQERLRAQAADAVTMATSVSV